MTAAAPGIALLLAAHGERRAGAANAGVLRVAAALSAGGIAGEVGVGFLNGSPTVDQAIGALAARRIVVYPLFLSDGYFVRVKLARVLEAARAGHEALRLQVLPPLGLDPGLPDLIVEQVAAARSPSPKWSGTSLVLLAHGSGSDPASRIAAERVASRIARRECFRAVRSAFLDEAPRLPEAVADLRGPVAIFGLFAGEGLHAGEDLPRLIAALGRSDAVLAGTIAGLDGIERLAAAAVTRALRDPGEERRAGALPPRREAAEAAKRRDHQQGSEALADHDIRGLKGDAEHQNPTRLRSRRS